MKTELEIAERALYDIINPVKAMRRDLREGYDLNGDVAYELSIDHNYLKDIAAKALRELKLLRNES